MAGSELRLYLPVAVLLELRKDRPILTVAEVVLGYPLPGVLSALRGYLGDPSSLLQVHLQPLVIVVLAGAPGPHPRANAAVVQPAVVWGVVFVPAGGSRNLSRPDASTLHAQRFVTCWTLQLKRASISRPCV